VPIL